MERVDGASSNNKVAACARFAHSGERGTEAAPATSGTLAGIGLGTWRLGGRVGPFVSKSHG